MKNPLKTLYFDPSLVSLLRDQPELILKLAQQNRKFLQVVAHPDKMGAASTDYSAELNDAVDTLKDREQLEYWIEQYLQEISNASQTNRELAVQKSITQNLTGRVKQLETENEELRQKIARLEMEVKTFDEKVQRQMMSWLMYRQPFTKVMVSDTRLFLPEIKNLFVEIKDSGQLKVYFIFDWKTIRILEGREENVRKHLAKMKSVFQEKGSLPGRKLPWSLIAGCIGNEPLYENREKIPLRQAHVDIQAISPFLKIGRNLVATIVEQGPKDPEPMVTFSREGIITDLREFSLE